MSGPLNLTEVTIRQYASQESFQRGREYYEQGAVLSVTRRGDQLVAEVQGSEYLPYRVGITLEPGALDDATCSCPYDLGGYCKHIVAVLLTCIRQPGRIEERPSVETILAGLGRDQLQALLLKLVEQQPELADRLENLATTLGIAPEDETPAESKPEATPSPHRHTRVDPTSIRRQVRATLRGVDYSRGSEAYRQVSSAVNEVRSVLGQARAALDAGDGDNALVILEAVTEEYLSGWEGLDDSDGEASDLFRELGQLWAEAVLTAELTPSQRKQWAERLTNWQGEVDQYGVDEAFDAAGAAAVQGWDYPPLRRVLHGKITERGAWVREAPWYADDLTQARLNVLERQGRTQEYLYLAEAEGQTKEYVTMLVKLGRIPEAVGYGLNQLSTAEEVLVLAQALAERKETTLALQVGEHGLTLEGRKTELARFLRGLAASCGQTELALRAGIAAFQESHDLADYQAAEALAGPQWPEVKASLLEHLASVSYAPARIEVYLYEGMVDAVVKVVEEGGYVGYGQLERVVDAAAGSHPDWAIAQCRREAESIMNQGKSKYYDHAVRWLRQAREVYLATGKGTEWQGYLQDLLTCHRRKSSLVPSLKKLG